MNPSLSLSEAVQVLGLAGDEIRGLLVRRRESLFQSRLRRRGWRPLADGRWLSPHDGRVLHFKPAAELQRALQKIRAARLQESEP